MKTQKRDILLFSVPRTGSTLVYNILKEVFGVGNVRTVHTFELPHNEIIISFRDYRDSLVSWRNRKRQRLSKDHNKKMSLYEVLRYIVWVKRYIKIQKVYENSNKKILWLRYERFYKDYDYICDCIEDYFSIKIDEDTRLAIKKKYNMDSLKEISSKLKRGEQDFDTKVSSFHLNTGEEGYWRKVIPNRYWFLVYLLLRKDLLRYGYSRVVHNGYSINNSSKEKEGEQ